MDKVREPVEAGLLPADTSATTAARRTGRVAWVVVSISVLFAALWAWGSRYCSHALFLLLYLFVLSLYLSFHAKRGRPLLYNLSFAFLALGLFEAYLNVQALALSRGATISGTYSAGGYFVPDPVRGYGAPRKAARYTSVSTNRRTGERIYDVVYTIDKEGLRETPAPATADDRLAWFFGCSFTVGEGVKDNETLPAAFAARSGVKSLNFGFHGYGPHQMLRMLETGYSFERSQKAPSLVIYNAIAVHIDRAAGLTSWDKDGPKYVATGGTAVYSGTFSEGRWFTKVLDKALFRSSLVYQLVVRPHIFARQPGDMDRYLAIVKRSADWVRERYGATFAVVLWDIFDGRSAATDAESELIAKELTQYGIPVVRASKALGESAEKYFIKGDGHPNGEGYARVAEFLAAQR